MKCKHFSYLDGWCFEKRDYCHAECNKYEEDKQDTRKVDFCSVCGGDYESCRCEDFNSLSVQFHGSWYEWMTR